MKRLLFLLIIFFAISLHSQNKIKKIEFSTKGYASAPDFDLIIYSDRTAIFNALSDNYKIPHNGEIVGYGTDKNGVNIKKSELKGIFFTKLKVRDYKKIVKLIIALEKDFDKKKFNSNTLHSSTGKLRVIFENGDAKYIYDDGMNGSKGLSELYNYMEDLRFKQKWK